MEYLLVLAFILIGTCSGIDKAAAMASDPSQILSAYASVTVCVTVLLFLGGHGIWRGILNSVRVTAVICVVTGPLLYLVYGDPKQAIAVTMSGLFGLVVVTVAFWKDLYPRKAPVVKKENDDDK